MTSEERELLNSMASKLEALTDRVAGMEIVLTELLQSHGKPELTAARLRIRADLLQMKGTPCAHLDGFLLSLK